LSPEGFQQITPTKSKKRKKTLLVFVFEFLFLNLLKVEKGFLISLVKIAK